MGVNEEQTAHLQTGLCTWCAPQETNRAAGAPFKSRDVLRPTVQQPSLPAVGLTCFLRLLQAVRSSLKPSRSRCTHNMPCWPSSMFAHPSSIASPSWARPRRWQRHNDVWSLGRLSLRPIYAKKPCRSRAAAERVNCRLNPAKFYTLRRDIAVPAPPNPPEVF